MLIITTKHNMRISGVDSFFFRASKQHLDNSWRWKWRCRTLRCFRFSCLLLLFWCPVFRRIIIFSAVRPHALRGGHSQSWRASGSGAAEQEHLGPRSAGGRVLLSERQRPRKVALWNLQEGPVRRTDKGKLKESNSLIVLEAEPCLCACVSFDIKILVATK